MSVAVIVGWERALMAAERVKQRLRRAIGGAGAHRRGLRNDHRRDGLQPPSEA